MTKLTYTKKIYILSGISLVSIIAIIFLILYPLYGQINLQNEEIYDKKVQLAIYQQQRSNIEKTQQDYNKIKNDISNISKIFVNKDQILDLISALENIAATHSVVQNINLDPLLPSDSNNVIPLRISLNGNWLNLIQYLDDLEKLDYYVVVNDLNFTKNNESLNLSISANVYGQ